MSEKYLLDASALLALINQEQGYEVVEKIVNSAVMSAVNFSEAVSALHKHGIEYAHAFSLLNDIILEVIPFNKNQAYLAASCTAAGKKYGLSLGDRACLGAAMDLKLPVVTADKVWAELKIDITVHLIR